MQVSLVVEAVEKGKKDNKHRGFVWYDSWK